VRIPWRTSAIVVLAIGLGIQVIRPAMTNPPVDPIRTIAAHVPIPADVAATLDRSCGDCHSNRTRWPWYDRLAPASWLVTNHVNDGRRAFNLDDWNAHGRGRQTPPIDHVCRDVRNGDMPLWSYLLIHRGARLSDADTQAICAWADAAAAEIAGK